ncbi:MAG TPA: histidine-type phosphatase [Terracidiphilus sp.]|nr:histidine-type phosphatase [Terracidiphilus sp.]
MRRLTLLLVANLILAVWAGTQPAAAQGTSVKGSTSLTGEKLQYAIYLSRHGVRSPTKKADEYQKYSSAPWPEWPVQPGYLTPHGYELMKLFGAYDRVKLAGEGLLAPSGCEDAAHVTILADGDQRTRETGKALAEGLMPGCGVQTHALAEGTEDPLFHGMTAEAADLDPALAVAAIGGRIGGDPGNITEAYRPQLAALDKILAGCGKVAVTNSNRTPLFDIPAVLEKGKGDHGAELRGPLATASTLSENLLLEYTQGMSETELGWGCLDEAALREAMQLHEAEEDYADRTPAIARMHASDLLDRIAKSLEQNATGKVLAGAKGKPDDRVLLLVGHDTNIATVAGVLGLDWIIDGRRDDTPPGGALVFELWRADGGSYSVRIFYTAQTLDQMREATPLTAANPPARVPVFVPGCAVATAQGAAGPACSLESFEAAVQRSIDPAYVEAQK